MPSAARVVQLDEYRWMLPREGGMRVPGVIFADQPLLDQMLSDRTPDQIRNAAHLPGILEASIAMPDAHWGYGLPVGGVVATDEHEGVVSPGAVGYDIGCGVRPAREPADARCDHAADRGTGRCVVPRGAVRSRIERRGHGRQGGVDEGAARRRALGGRARDG